MNELLKPKSPFSCAPGQLIQFDDFNEVRAAPLTPRKEIFAVQWNIERAYKLDAIIELLKRDFMEADVIALQELDVHCERSGWRDSALEIARVLKMRCIFVPEFEELHSPTRSAKNQGGGEHGNAIFTWWDVDGAEVISHSKEFNWPDDGHKLGEPRRGGRFSVAAFLKNPHEPQQRVLAYSVHLEVFCGIFGRMRQFSQLLSHSRSNLVNYPYQMILGDLNTMAHGLARFFSRYCCDAMRWRSLGWSEAEWWQKNLMQVTPEWAGPDGINALLAAHHHLNGKRSVGGGNEETPDQFIEDLIEEDEAESSEALNASTSKESQRIFTMKQLKDLVNPHFYCPFSPRFDMTLKVRGFAGKLDWMLVRGFRVLEKGMENDRFDRSDHKLLWLKAEYFVPNEKEEEAGVEAYAQYFESVDDKRGRIASMLGPELPFRRVLVWSATLGFFSSILYIFFNSNKNRS